MYPFLKGQDAHAFKIWNLQEFELTLAPTLKKYSFHLGALKKHHYIRCQSQAELDDWMHFLGKFTQEVSMHNSDAPLIIHLPKKHAKVI